MLYKEKLCQLFTILLQLTEGYWAKQRAIADSIQSKTAQHQPQGGPTPALGFKETPLKLFDIHCKLPHNQIIIMPGEPS